MKSGLMCPVLRHQSMHHGLTAHLMHARAGGSVTWVQWPKAWHGMA
jgi:hypothetical protein